MIFRCGKITQVTIARAAIKKCGELSNKKGEKGGETPPPPPGGDGGTKTTNPYNLKPTHSQTLSNKQMNALVEDIEKNGIQNPIKYVDYNGQMYVVDGHHRLLAAKRLKLSEVPVEKVELPYAGYNTIDDLLWFD